MLIGAAGEDARSGPRRPGRPAACHVHLWPAPAGGAGPHPPVGWL